MSRRPGYALKTDGCHAEIVEYLRLHGVEVHDFASARNALDVLFFYDGQAGWIEFKMSKQNRPRYTYQQLRFIAETRMPVFFASDRDAALTFARTLRGGILQIEKDRMAYRLAQMVDRRKLFTPNQVERMMAGGSVRDG